MAKEIQDEKVQNSDTIEETLKVNNEANEITEEKGNSEEEVERETEENPEDPSDAAKVSEQEEEQEEVDELEKLKADLEESKDKHLRLYSEFENFRRRTAKERLDLIKTANEDLLVSLLPVLDDFERAHKSMEENDDDNKAMKEGFDLIYNKFKNILKQRGLKPLDDKVGTVFNAELHEAIAQSPAPKKSLKGKIIDVIEKGYYLNEKVIRFSKVVIGS